MPIYVAASGPAAAKLAGRVADGFICTSGKAPELYSETLIPALNEGAEKAGRDPNSIERMIEMKVSFDTDKERALQDTRYWGALALKPEEKTGVEDPMELERLADALPVERAASRWIVSDDPEEQVARIQPYIDLGFTHLVFHAPGPDQERFLRLYATEVLPRLQRSRCRRERGRTAGDASDRLAGAAHEGRVEPRMTRRIEVEVEGAKAEFELRDDLAPQTVAALWESLPIETSIRHGELSGSACFIDVEHGPIASIAADPELPVTSIYKGWIVAFQLPAWGSPSCSSPMGSPSTAGRQDGSW